ncbi:hypothetical protein GA0070616_3642 [Micromonospora nigra]|uniref:Uncharacterized protein n=1 Tax=Micromonospora nigra TaxID=145857 RepID=A0A1C6SFD5_9ACTN|nr:hypothetical protein [Micromonospora nigra]SCL28172.1 hypothetical protein GA0070616_3642 [Micromonospora nigra]
MIMAVRRHAARIATVCAVLGGVVAFGATPAHADGDQVRARSAGSFTAGRSAEGVTVEVRKRTDGCVLARTALGLTLIGLRADQVAVQANVGGRWVAVAVSGSRGTVRTAPVVPANGRLCKGKGLAARYRVAFAATAPNGRLVVVGEATTAQRQVIGRGAVASRVVGGVASASPTPSRKPSPTPTPSDTGEPTVEGTVPAVALADQAGGTAVALAAEEGGESSGGLPPVMFFGIGMVAVGFLLIVLLVRRSREDRRPRGDVPPPPLPRNPGGTTYRSGQGPATAPVPPGQVYGQQPSARPATPGVYGGGGARPSGSVYGAPAVDRTQAMPPGGPVPGGAALPLVVPGQPTGPVSGPPSAPGAMPLGDTPGAMPPGAVPPGATTPGQPGAVPPQGRRGEPPAEAGGGDHTVFMPRLPG